MITPDTYLTLHQQHADSVAYEEVLGQARAGLLAPGIYRYVPSAHYHAVPALSNSGMGDLEVSQYRFWYLHVNPRRPERVETEALRLGTALHAAVLEPDTFLDRYNCKVTKEDFEGCLDTNKDLKDWLIQNGGSTKGPNKEDFVREVVRVSKATSIPVRILDVEMQRHAATNQGKILLHKQEWERVNGMAKALLGERALQPLLAHGERELSLFVKDPETGVLLKARIDWLQKHRCEHCAIHGNGNGKVWKTFNSQDLVDCDVCNGAGFSAATVVDPKTYSTQDLTVDQAIGRAYRYRGYIRQGWLYLYLLKILGIRNCRWINAFVESDAPYEVRLRALGNNLTATARYWDSTGMQVLKMIRQYAKCLHEFGDRAWCNQQAIKPLEDSEVPNISYRSEQELS